MSLISLTNLLDQPVMNPTLVLDSRRCRYSSELLKELKRIDFNNSISVIDTGQLSIENLQTIPWLLGVPCLLYDNNIFLGVDSFSKCREIARSSILKK